MTNAETNLGSVDFPSLIESYGANGDSIVKHRQPGFDDIVKRKNQSNLEIRVSISEEVINGGKKNSDSSLIGASGGGIGTQKVNPRNGGSSKIGTEGSDK